MLYVPRMQTGIVKAQTGTVMPQTGTVPLEASVMASLH